MTAASFVRYAVPPLFLAIVLAGVAWLWLGNTGERAPAAEFETLDGDRVALADLRDRPVIVYFWATDCASCMREMPDLVDLYETYRDQGLAFVAVAMQHDDPAAVRRLVERRDLPFDVVTDSDGSHARTFDNVRVTPTKFLIGPDGRFRLRHIGSTDYAALRRQVEALL